jgi:hypothetical protein
MTNLGRRFLQERRPLECGSSATAFAVSAQPNSLRTAWTLPTIRKAPNFAHACLESALTKKSQGVESDVD